MEYFCILLYNLFSWVLWLKNFRTLFIQNNIFYYFSVELPVERVLLSFTYGKTELPYIKILLLFTLKESFYYYIQISWLEEWFYIRVNIKVSVSKQNMMYELCTVNFISLEHSVWSLNFHSNFVVYKNLNFIFFLWQCFSFKNRGWKCSFAGRVYF